MHGAPLAPIAIIGISAELPSGDYSDENLDFQMFKAFLHEKRDSYGRVPGERFNVDLWRGKNAGHIFTDTGSFLKDISMFDYLEFGINPKDAKALAVGTRRLIENSFLALWDAGIQYRGRNIGTYMSAVAHDILSVGEHAPTDAAGSFAGAYTMVANKVAYHLDLCGPSLPVDTACSSTATATHLAVQAIRAGECEAAVVGGCQVNSRFIDIICYSQGGVLAPDGMCKPFDAGANGFSRGEGCVAIVLKPLDKAIADGDYIYGSILGTGINATGNSAPVYAPLAIAQEDAMRKAYVGTGKSPQEVDFIELHATGTSVGDPIEANWVGKAFARDDELLIGSVKGNIGHTEIVSFMASLCKVLWIFQDHVVPPNVKLNKLNQKVKWKQWKLRVPTDLETITPRHPSGKLLISMNSSGIGGSNAHVLVESHKPNVALSNEIPSNYPVLLLAGALSDSSTSAVAKQLVDLADGNKDIAALALAFGRRSMQMNWRSFAVTLPGATPIFSSPRFIPRNRPALVWVCSGQGPQHIAMGRQLFNQFPVFRSSILELDSVYLAATGESMIARTGLFSNNAGPKLPAIWPIEITLPAIAMVQLALIDLFRSLGIVPDAVVGHSAGETTMMYASGATSKALALEIAIARGLAVAELEALEGSMVAFSCDPIVADEIISEVRASIDAPDMILDVACYNAETAVVLAGHVLLLEKAKEIAKARNIMVNQIATRVPFHSTMMEACKTSYLQRVSAVFAKYRTEECIPKIPAYSTMTGEIWQKAFTADYFWDNARSPVEFLSAINTILVDMPNATFLEISPHPVLSSYVSSIRGTADVVFCGMRRKREYPQFGEYTQLLESIGGLAVTGYDSIDLRALTGVRTAPIPSPFKYPFSKKDVPVYSDVCRTSLDHMDTTYRGPLCSSPLRINSSTHPDLTQHVINSQPIMAAAGFLEMGFELGGRTLWNVNFRTMLPLIADKTISVEVKREDSRWSVSSYKPGSLDEVRFCRMVELITLRLHTDGFLSTELAGSPPAFDIAALQKGRKVIESEEFYAPINHFAQYGPMFRRVTRFWRGANEGLAEIRGFAPDLTEHGYNYIVHPAILDACFHAMVLPASADNDPNSYHLPLSVEYVALHQSALFPQSETPADTFYAYVEMKNWTPEEIKFDLEILLPTGQSVLSLHGFSVAHHEKVTGITNAQSFELVYQPYMLPEWPTKMIGSANGHANGISSDGMQDVQSVIKATIDFAVQGGKKVVRVLEVGAASTQLLSQPKIASLVQNPGAADVIVHYTCADTSSVSIPPFAHYTKLDLAGSEPSSLLSTFDIVLACGAENGVDAASFLSKLLLPGGLLVVSDASVWKNSLKSVGFTVVSGLGTAGIAQKPRVISSEASPELAVVEYPATANSEPNSLLALQAVFNELRQSGPKELWLHANSDETSGSAAGFTRVLRVEVPDLKLYLVFFDKSWDTEKRTGFIHSIAHLPNLDKEFEVDASGNILNPRYVPSAIPNASLTEESTISPESVVPPSLIPDQHILIEIGTSGEAQAGFKGVAGKVLKSTSSQWKEGDHVVGVVAASQKDFPTPYVVAHEGQFASLPASNISQNSAFLALPIAIIGIALGVSSVKDIKRLQRWKVGVVGLLNHAICEILMALGVNAKVASTNPEERSLAALRDSDFVIASGLGKNDAQVIRGSVRPQTSVFVWDDAATGLATELSRNPWLIGDIISEFFAHHGPIMETSPVPAKSNVTDIKTTKSLFRADRSYLLVGGIGSMGMKIALWMYENGARNIVMTSRSGARTLDRPRYEAGKRIAEYTKTLPGLNLQLEACDGASPKAMTNLISSLSLPLAGVMLLSASINDRLFSAHDEDSWSSPFISKVHVFKALEASCSLDSLDFVIAFSSATILGSLGQANYAGANSAVDYLVRKLPNAFAIVCPAILDSVLFETTNELNTDVTRWSTWGMTCSELCHHIRLGLLKMRQQPFYLYVPPWSWDKASAGLGTACLPMFYHLFSDDAANGGSTGKKDASADVIKNIVLSFLDVAEDDFSMSTPLTSYGLDSLSAGHLSVALRPYLQIAQMQLLSDITTEDIVKLTQGDGDEDDDEGSGGAPASKLTPVVYTAPSVQEKRYDWQTPPNQPGETLIKLIDRPGETPLIFTHGGGGNLLTFIPLQEQFNSALWGVQVTPETPLESVERTARYYFEKIKEAQPHGPYRIGGYCASALIAYELVYQFQQAGDEISQWVMLDFSPAIFGSYHFTTGLDEETIRTRVPTKDVMGIGIRLMDRMTELDTNEGAKTVIAEIWDAHNGLPARDHIKLQHRAFSGIGLGALDLFFKLAGDDEKVLRDPAALEQRMLEWAARVTVPMQLVLPRQSGARSLFPDGDASWEMLGTERFAKNFERFDVNGGHLTMMEDPKLAQFLESGGRK
ncbi:hypothetical protein DFH05DRAFT_1550591 [Lentinula detonsa]|uniref:Polyketide synthase n=1 Tax=Lentinula detonsa TaxID=2804962 RepID=A0A9W8NZR0_9AGAR|nr:hypothetical protein DFH05DRAFT_1550591 [Lentinula detonsa]